MSVKMAATPESKFLEKISEDFLCCAICLEHFKSPKILPCLHTFCEQCLVTLVEKIGSLNCPECRHEHQLPVGGVEALKGNTFMTNLIEMFEQRLETVKRAKIDCSGCEENVGTHRCVECELLLCDVCVKAHRIIPVTRSHQLIAIDEFRTVQSTNPVVLQPLEYCSAHPNNELEFYCETCQVPVCVNCTIVKHRIPEHVHRDLKDAADEYLTELKVMVDKLKVKEQEAEKNKTLAKQIHTDLTEQCSREERKVRMKAEEIIKKVKTEEQRLIDELKNNYKLKIKRAAVDIDEMELKHGNIKSAGNYIETLMHHGNAAQLLSTKGDVSTRIKHLVTMETRAMIEQEDFIFTPNDEFCEHGILGTLESQDDIEISRNTIEIIPKHEEKTKAEAMKTCKHSEKVTELKKALYDERQKIQDLMKELEESNNQLQTCQSLKDEVQLLREELGIERSEKQKKEEEYASLIHQLENSDVLQVERQATGDIAAQQRFPNPFEDEERELRQQHFDGNQDQTDKLSGTVCMTNVGVTRPHSAAALFQQPIRPLGHPMFPGRQLVLSSPSPTNTTGRLPPPLEPEVLSSARQAAVRNSGRLRNTGTVRNQTILREALDDETIIEDRDDGLKEFHDAPEYPAESAMKWCQECHLLFPPSCPQDTFDQHVESHFGRVCPMCKVMFPKDPQAQESFEHHVQQHFEQDM